MTMKLVWLHLVLLVLCSVQSLAGQGSGEMLSDFLAPPHSPEEKARMFLQIVANQGEYPSFQEAATNSHSAVSGALQTVMHSTSSEARAAVITAITLLSNAHAYKDFMIQALDDSNSKVRAAALSAAVASNVSRSVIIAAALEEIQEAQTGPALRVALAIVEQYGITTAQRPIARILVDQSGRVNELAARALASYNSLPADLRPVIEEALAKIEGDIVKTEIVYNYVPSAKRSTTTIPAKRVRAYLNKALANCENPSTNRE